MSNASFSLMFNHAVHVQWKTLISLLMIASEENV